MIVILFLAYCTGNMSGILVLYGAVMLHEAAHLAACVALKEKPGEIRLMPYGVNLQIKEVKNPVHTMLISAAGPGVSLLAYLVAENAAPGFAVTFKTANLLIFSLNVCPALPLDGGNILESVFSYRSGYIKAHKIMIDITRVVALVFAIFGIIFLLISKYNISLLVISGFLMYNLKEERKKFIFLRKMIYTKEFNRKSSGLNIRHSAVCENVNAASLTNRFGYNYICHFFVYDADMKLLGALTQSDIIDGVVLYGAGATAGRILLHGGTNEYTRKSREDIAEGV